MGVSEWRCDSRGTSRDLLPWCRTAEEVLLVLFDFQRDPERLAVGAVTSLPGEGPGALKTMGRLAGDPSAFSPPETDSAPLSLVEESMLTKILWLS